jgi:Tol biopolymer transport system component
VALDERLERELERAARLGDPAGVYEDLVRRRERLRIRRRVTAGAIAFVVFIGGAFGVYALSRTIGTEPQPADAGPLSGRIVFSTITEEDGTQSPQGWHLVSMNPDGSDRVDIVPDDITEADFPTASPDGTQIALAGFHGGRHGLYVMDVDGSHADMIWRANHDTEFIDALAWSPDGERIAMLLEAGTPTGTAPDSGPQDFDWATTIWTVAPDGSNLEQVTTSGRETGLSWSPDSTRLAFSRHEPIDPDSTVATDVYVVGADGSNETQLTHDGDSSSPAWSPDGTTIAFDRSSPEGGIDLALMDADGSNVRPLTTAANGNEFGAAWSPSGDAIVFSELQPNQDRTHSLAQISVIRSDGSDYRVLTQSEISPAATGLWWSVAPMSGMSPRPTAVTGPTSPTGPSATTGADTSVRDVASNLAGVGPVCGATSATGRFLPSSSETTAYVFEPEPAGGCDGPNENFQYLGVADISGDITTVSPKLRDCLIPVGCWAFAAPDIDHDGIDEIAVGTGDEGGSIQYELYATDGSSLSRLGYDCSNCNAYTFDWGRAGGHAQGTYCEPMDAPGDFVEWNAERTDAGDYALLEISIDVKGRFLTDIDRTDTTLPYVDSALPAGGAGDFCGAPVSPPPVSAP